MEATEPFHDFFVAAAGVAGALIGLLFVAISVAPERITPQGSHVHRIRASAALTAFSNALIVSLFALIPPLSLGWTATFAAGAGLIFVGGALIEAVDGYRQRAAKLRDSGFLIALIVVFAWQLRAGIRLIGDRDNEDGIETVAILQAVCFPIGIARAWELIGGPSMGLTTQLVNVVRRRHRLPTEPDQDAD
jgi:hypothetical protein